MPERIPCADATPDQQRHSLPAVRSRRWMYAPRWRAVPKLRRQRELLFPSARQKLPCFYCVGGGQSLGVLPAGAKAGLLEGSSLEALPPITSTPIASADVRDRVYSQMLQPALKPHHRKHLLTARQLSEETIDRLDSPLRSLAARMRRTGAELAATFDLSGVPGFFQKMTAGACTPSARVTDCIPLQDSIGRVIGCKCDAGDDPKRRYFTLSGAPGSYTGANAGAPWHWAKRNKEARSLVIVDGILKATWSPSISVARARSSDWSAIRRREVSGMTSGQHFPLAAGADRVRLRRRRHGRATQHRQSAGAGCGDSKGEGYAAQVMQWDEGKGLDDFLLAEDTQKYVDTSHLPRAILCSFRRVTSFS